MKTFSKIVLPLNGGFVEVKPLLDNEKLVKGFGYFDPEEGNNNADPIIYIYRGKFKGTTIPGSIYKTESGIMKVPHQDEYAEENYSFARTKSINIDSIKKDMKKKEPKRVEVENSYIEGDFFMPQIRDDDDILKKIIKKTLQKMKINLKTLKPKFSNDYDLNNLKSQLCKKGAMSTKYFSRWVEILDIEVDVIVTDTLDRVDEPIEIKMK